MNVMITGAGTGIGRALALKLAANGHEVIGIGRRLEPLQELQTHHPHKIKIIQADISLPADREKITQQTTKLNRPLYLVHNAAIVEPFGLLKDVALEEWRAHQAVNVEGPLFLTQQLLPYLKNGRVLHISSGFAHVAYPGVGAYCVSKAALYMLYQCLREELKEFNIAVGSAAISQAIDTPMQDIIRSTDKNKLPSVDYFIGFKEKGELTSPTLVATFLENLLLHTNNEVFSQKEWNFPEPISSSY